MTKATGHKMYWEDWKKWKNIDSFPDYEAKNFFTKKELDEHRKAEAKWERMALNAPTQGSGAVIIKYACILFFKWILQNKSKLNIELPNDVSFYDYLLGLIDGDGGFYKGQKGSQLKLLCRKPMLDQIVEKLQQDLPIPTSIWTSKHPRTEGLYELVVGNGINNQNFKYLYNKFYENKTYNSLQRKKEKMEQIMS